MIVEFFAQFFPDLSKGFAAFGITIVSGFFGAAFFMLAQLQSNIAAGTLGASHHLWSYSHLLLRCLVGVGGAIVLYFFFQTGLLDGSIWPDLTEIGTHAIEEGSLKNRLIPNKDMSLLIIWSCLAGYSQTLVPSIMEHTAAKASSTKKK